MFYKYESVCVLYRWVYKENGIENNILLKGLIQTVLDILRYKYIYTAIPIRQAISLAKYVSLYFTIL